MLNRYPTWKYLLLALAVILGVIYAIPNLFEDEPSVQINGRRGVTLTENTIQQVEQILKQNNLEPKEITHNQDGMLVVFDTKHRQERLIAREVLERSLSQDYVVAQASRSTVPNWLRSIGAEPMRRGLDLSGGVYFLMEVDMHNAMKSMLDQRQVSMQADLQKGKLAYSKLTLLEKGIEIQFANSADRDKARIELQSKNGDMTFESVGSTLLRATLSDARLAEIRESAIQQNITILRNRVNQLGVAEPIVQRQGIDRIVVQLPGVDNPARAKEILGATASLEFRQQNTSVDAAAIKRGLIPGGSEIKYMANGQPIVVYKRVILTGDHIVYATSDRDSLGQPAVSVTLDSAGGDIMADFTRRNKDKWIATLFIEYRDNGKRDAEGKVILERHEEIISVAAIRSEFSRNFQISGSMTSDEARNLSTLLRAGALIAPIRIVEERTLGASLGPQNVQQGTIASIAGLAVSIVFMLLVYRLFGLFASLALILNVILIIAFMSLLPGAVLTMPGIAGIVLTVGMAVDANVLINERIKEELRNGRSPQQAIHEGYNGAFTSIFDANITTLMTAIILYGFGTGSIKGFAVTLGIGILTSMFTSIVGTRALANLVYGGRRVNKLSI